MIYSRFKKIFLFSLFLGVVLFLRLGPFSQYLTFVYFKQNRDLFFAFVHTHYWYSVSSYILIYMILSAFAFPAAWILTVAGGFLFGILLGTLFTNIAATAGAALLFLGS